VFSALLAALTLALSSCGESAPANRSATAAKNRNLGVKFEGKSATIPFASPAVIGQTILADYTCEGKDAIPPLQWGSVPSDTKELALFVLSFGGGLVASGSAVEWAVSGLSPSTHAIEGGTLPPHAITGRNDRGNTSYTICPTRGANGNYLFLLYAVPRSLSIRPGLKGSALLSRIGRHSPFGAFLFHYTRA
jgi:phosphatidylethanolamine-binding protein (PEBP) family uncharacterized protein